MKMIQINIEWKIKLNQKHITPKRRVFLADAAVQSEAWKIIFPKYRIREFEAKNFELATLIHVFLRPKEIVSWHDGIICFWLNRLEWKFWKLVKLKLQNPNVALCNSSEDQTFET